MLGTLTEKLTNVFSKLGKQRKLTEENMGDAVRQVRLALLEADVNYGVAKTLVKKLKERSVGTEVLKSVSPSQQFVKIVHDELVDLMGSDESSLALEQSPTSIMMCGLQGSGKTTHSAKLALWVKKQKKGSKPLLVACDLARPAAVDQLKTLGEQIDVPVFCVEGCKDPTEVGKKAMLFAKEQDFDVIIFDTAGRLHIDEALMEELKKLHRIVDPAEVLFVANATTGQDAVNTAAAFDQKLSITGSILTMLDGNARAGAAISIRQVTGKPLKFEGIGEKVTDFQPFHPKSMADRILGMGDTINLVRHAQEHMDESKAQEMEQKLRKASFTYEDYLSQMQSMKKMGSLKKLLGMLPGVKSQMLDQVDEKQMVRIESIILSMTPDERQERVDLGIPRRKRIAKGSGNPLDEVNRLVKSFKQAKKFFKNMPNMKKMEKMMGGTPWR